MLLSLAALAAVGAPWTPVIPPKSTKCLKTPSEPPRSFLPTVGEGQFRIARQDFHPRQWRSGDDLQICSQSGPPDRVEIKDIRRGELLAAERLHKGIGSESRRWLSYLPPSLI